MSWIISSEANEIISTSFLPLSNVNSDRSDLISAWVSISVLKISVARGRPLGLIEHTHPGLDHHKVLFKKSHAYNIDEKK